MVNIDNIRKLVNQVVSEARSRCPRVICKRKGIRIKQKWLEDTEGYYYCSKGIKTIVVNSRISYDRQTMVIAHELGHAIMGHDMSTNFIRTYTRFSTDRYEVEANFFGFELVFNNGEERTYDELIDKYGLEKEEIRQMGLLVCGQRTLAWRF